MPRAVVISLLFLLSVFVAVPPVTADNHEMTGEIIGEVVLASGVVTASADGGTARILAKGSPVHRGETLGTASDSFVVVRLHDHSRITLRPRSEVVLQEFNRESGSEAALFNLLKGGLRALSGDIGKKRPRQFRVKTPVATIGIRGTDFVARLCGDDCRQEELTYGDRPRQTAGKGGIRKKEILLEGEEDTGSSGGFLDCRPASDIRHGLYTLVLEGGIYVTQSGRRVNLDAVEALLVEDRQIVCLNDIPHFLLRDDYLSEDPGDTVTLYNILRNIEDERQHCAIPEA